jgi:hypothetical protein
MRANLVQLDQERKVPAVDEGSRQGNPYGVEPMVDRGDCPL